MMHDPLLMNDVAMHHRANTLVTIHAMNEIDMIAAAEAKTHDRRH